MKLRQVELLDHSDSALYICLISDSLFNVRFPTCEFYLSISDVIKPPNLLSEFVISNCKNVISRGLPIFRRFCKSPRNVVTETFAEPSGNWEVSSNRILTGRIRGLSRSFICVKLVIHYLTHGVRPVSSIRQNVMSKDFPIFRKFCKPPRNFFNKYTCPLFMTI